MKLGFVSAILDNKNFEEVIDIASDLGYECVELACWPVEKATRRYAGVSHLDVSTLDDAKVEYINNYTKERNVEISSLAYYPNPLDPETGEKAVNHIKELIVASSRLGVNMITTFIGRDQTLSVEDNLKLVAQTWPEIIALAEELKVKIAIENCPMLFTEDQWPGGQNVMTSPANWKKVFEILDSEYIGINIDPSHFVWQFIDYIKPVYEFKNKIFHVHCKDIKLYREKLDEVGITAYPLEFMSPKLPGLGDVDFGMYISALTDIEFNGYICIEIEDKAFEKNDEDVLKSLILSKRYLEQFII